MKLAVAVGAPEPSAPLRSQVATPGNVAVEDVIGIHRHTCDGTGA